MKKKWMKLVTMALMLVVLATALPFAQADAVVLHPYPAYRSLGFTNAYLNGVYAGTRTSYYPAFVYPIEATQVLHKSGATTTITITRTETQTVRASGDFKGAASAQISAGMKELAVSAFASMAVEERVEASAAYTVSAGISFTLESNIDTGFYRIKS